MPKKAREAKVKFSFGILSSDRDELFARAGELETTPSEIVRKLTKGFLSGKVKLPRTEAMNRNYEQ